MIEVFRTNVECREQANRLIGEIHKNFPGYKVNFDLDDCDRILRVVSENGSVAVSSLMSLVKNFGFSVEVLPDL